MRELFRSELEAGRIERFELEHPYPGSVLRLVWLIDQGVCPVVIPRRRRDDVVRSWDRYGKDVNNFCGRSLTEWFEIQEELCIPARARGIFFCIDIDDPEARDEQLAFINDSLGLELETDWTPVRQPGAEDPAA